ncbi:hypothetical protein L345_10013, partial [Ophiophagus hannah]
LKPAAQPILACNEHINKQGGPDGQHINIEGLFKSLSEDAGKLMKEKERGRKFGTLAPSSHSFCTCWSLAINPSFLEPTFHVGILTRPPLWDPHGHKSFTEVLVLLPFQGALCMESHLGMHECPINTVPTEVKRRPFCQQWPTSPFVSAWHSHRLDCLSSSLPSLLRCNCPGFFFPLCNGCPNQLHPLHLQQWTEEGGHSAIYLPDISSIWEPGATHSPLTSNITHYLAPLPLPALFIEWLFNGGVLFVQSDIIYTFFHSSWRALSFWITTDMLKYCMWSSDNLFPSLYGMELGQKYNISHRLKDTKKALTYVNPFRQNIPLKSRAIIWDPFNQNHEIMLCLPRDAQFLNIKKHNDEVAHRAASPMRGRKDSDCETVVLPSRLPEDLNWKSYLENLLLRWFHHCLDLLSLLLGCSAMKASKLASDLQTQKNVMGLARNAPLQSAVYSCPSKSRQVGSHYGALAPVYPHISPLLHFSLQSEICPQALGLLKELKKLALPKDLGSYEDVPYWRFVWDREGNQSPAVNTEKEIEGLQGLLCVIPVTGYLAGGEEMIPTSRKLLQLFVWEDSPRHNLLHKHSQVNYVVWKKERKKEQDKGGEQVYGASKQKIACSDAIP